MGRRKRPIDMGLEELLRTQVRPDTAAETLGDMDMEQLGQTETSAPGELERGNIDLHSRPRVRNQDGSISTVRSMSANFDGKEYLIPTVVGDRVVSDREAIDEFRRTRKHLGAFDTPENATRYAEQLHRDQEREYTQPRGEVFRGRVGKGGADPSMDELSQIEVQPPPVDMAPAKEATARGEVLRGRVGADPKEELRRLSGLLGVQPSEEEMDAEVTSKLGSGLRPEQAIEEFRKDAKEGAIASYAQKQKANPSPDNDSWVKDVLLGIADATQARYGGGIHDVSDRHSGIEAEGAQAEFLADRLKQVGIAYPEGAEKKNPKAFIATYGGLAKGERGEKGWNEAEYRRRKQIDAEFDKAPKGFDEAEYRRRKEIDKEFAPEDQPEGLTPNAQASLVTRIQKEDNVARRSLSSLDRAMNQVGTGAGDIGLLYRFINQMDDTAAREGELDLAQRGQAIADRLRSKFGTITEGTLIGPELRAQMLEELQISRKQLQDQRRLTISSQRRVAAALRADPAVLESIDGLYAYGEDSTIPEEDRKNASPDKSLGQQLDSGVGGATDLAGEATDVITKMIGGQPVRVRRLPNGEYEEVE